MIDLIEKKEAYPSINNIVGPYLVAAKENMKKNKVGTFSLLCVSNATDGMRKKAVVAVDSCDNSNRDVVQPPVFGTASARRSRRNTKKGGGSPQLYYHDCSRRTSQVTPQERHR